MLRPQYAVSLTAEELEKLIPAAQGNNPAALDRLCKGFVLLIFDLTKEEIVYNYLREDGVNIAWEAFLKLVKSYKGPDYRSFPGLVKKVVKHRLFLQLSKLEHQRDTQVSYEESLENGQQFTVLQDDIAQLFEHEGLLQAFKQLDSQEQLILYRSFFLDIPLKEQAVLQGVSPRTIARKYHKALEKLKGNLENTELGNKGLGSAGAGNFGAGKLGLGKLVPGNAGELS